MEQLSGDLQRFTKHQLPPSRHFPGSQEHLNGQWPQVSTNVRSLYVYVADAAKNKPWRQQQQTHVTQIKDRVRNSYKIKDP